jgi:hypothetical protein
MRFADYTKARSYHDDRDDRLRFIDGPTRTHRRTNTKTENSRPAQAIFDTP